MPAGPYPQTAWVAGNAPTAAQLTNQSRAINYLQGTPFTGDDEAPKAFLYQTIAQSLANNAATAISFDSETFDTANGHSTSVNTTRWTCPTGKQGWYLAFYQAAFASNGTGDRLAWVQVNGAHHAGMNSVQAASTHQTVLSGATGFFYLAVGDYVELAVEQYSGGSLSTDVGFGSNLSIWQVRVQ